MTKWHFKQPQFNRLFGLKVNAVKVFDPHLEWEELRNIHYEYNVPPSSLVLFQRVYVTICEVHLAKWWWNRLVGDQIFLLSQKLFISINHLFITLLAIFSMPCSKNDIYCSKSHNNMVFPSTQGVWLLILIERSYKIKTFSIQY